MARQSMDEKHFCATSRAIVLRAIRTPRPRDRRGPATILGLIVALLGAAMMLYASAASAAVRPAGQERSFAPAASGPAAASWNPALLALFPERRVELFSLRAGLGNDSFTLREYAQLNGSAWDEEDKQSILSAIEDETVELAGEASVRAAGVSFGPWAVATETRGASRMAVPKQLLELMLYGNTVGETFDVDGSSAEGAAFTELRVSLALPAAGILGRAAAPLGDWCVGVSAKMLKGWAYGRLLEAEGGVTTTVERLYGEGYFKILSARGGRGFGFDLGAAGPIGRGWTASVSARDLFASIEWDDGVEEQTDYFEVPGMALGDDDEVVISESVTVPLQSVRTDLPQTYALGVAHHGRRLLTTFHLEAASASRMGLSSALRLGAGAAWSFKPWLVLRSGVSVGGADAAAVSGGAGFGLGPVQLDLGLCSWGNLNPFASKGVGVVTSIGMGI